MRLPRGLRRPLCGRTGHEQFSHEFLIGAGQESFFVASSSFSEEDDCVSGEDKGVGRGILSRASAIARTKSRTPSPVAAEIAWNSRCLARQKSRKAWRRVRSVVASRFVATTIMGFSERDSLNARSSPAIISKE